MFYSVRGRCDWNSGRRHMREWYIREKHRWKNNNNEINLMSRLAWNRLARQLTSLSPQTHIECFHESLWLEKHGYIITIPFFTRYVCPRYSLRKLMITLIIFDISVIAERQKLKKLLRKSYQKLSACLTNKGRLTHIQVEASFRLRQYIR